MIKQILKTVLAGVLAAIALFVLPFFLLRMFVFFLLIGAIFKLLGGSRRGMHYRYAYAHHFRNMSEEDRNAFRSRYGARCGYPMDKNSSESVKQETADNNENK